MHQFVKRAPHRRRRSEAGFTLIELLVVIAVLAILAAIVIFNVVGVANKGSVASACTDQKSVQTAVDAAINDGVGPFAAGGMTAAEWNLLVPAYLHTGPAGSGLANTPAKYGNITPNWTLTSTGANGGYTVANNVTPGC